jgi:hypothetical protein
MKILLFFLVCTVFVSGQLHAEEKRLAATFSIYKTENATELKNQSEYVFTFKNLKSEDLNAIITLQMDAGKTEKIQLRKGEMSYTTKPGKHRFVVYINENYFELYSHELDIESQQRQFYYVYVQETQGIQIEVDKPVIYLYPETINPFEVQVKPKGKINFTYPELKNSWTGIMHPDGKLTIGDENYRYLFWESTQKMNALDPNKTEGFVVSRNELIDFLEKQLNTAGFNACERADFMTFWVPQMIKHDQLFITFHQDKACDDFAALEITPTPDHINRFYMSWGNYSGSATPKPQVILPIKRDGFNVLEWGGQEIPAVTTSLTL